MEEQYTPALDVLSTEEQALIAASQRKLSERRLDSFNSVMKDGNEIGFYGKAVFQVIKLCGFWNVFLLPKICGFG